MADGAITGSTSPRYSSDEGIDLNSVMSTHKRSSSVDKDGRESRLKESDEGSCRSSRGGAGSCEHKNQMTLRPRSWFPVPLTF